MYICTTAGTPQPSQGGERKACSSLSRSRLRASGQQTAELIARGQARGAGRCHSLGEVHNTNHLLCDRGLLSSSQQSARQMPCQQQGRGQCDVQGHSGSSRGRGARLMFKALCPEWKHRPMMGLILFHHPESSPMLSALHLGTQ